MSFRLPIFLFILVSFLQPALAEDSSFQRFVKTEKQILSHEQQLSKMASALEEWLSGRSKRSVLLETLKQVESATSRPPSLPAMTQKAVESSERDMLRLVREFATSKDPDGDGQRRLFSGMSQTTEKRTLALLSWRTATVKELLSRKLPADRASQLTWEAAWYPIWAEEAKYTRRLQAGLLEEATRDQSDILKGLLALRVRAQAIPCPPRLTELQKMSLERLTLLARTAEQLLRLEKRQSRGALTRVRRLSRKLSDLTEQFQSRRLELLP